MLRRLAKEEGLDFRRLAQHVNLQPLQGKRPGSVNGWRLLSRTQWLRRDDQVVCVVGKDAKAFIEYVNSYSRHPAHGAFCMEDKDRLAHLLNSLWIWSNNEKVNHMHSWELLPAVPHDADRLLVHAARGSAFAPDEAVSLSCAYMPCAARKVLCGGGGWMR